MYKKILILFCIANILVISCDYTDQNHKEQPKNVLFDLEPQISLVSNTQALITWDTEYIIGGILKYGTKIDELVNELTFYRSSEIQYTSIDNLNPNTKYYYSLIFNPEDKYLPCDTLSFQTLNIEEPIINDLTNYQQHIISKLTGHSAIGDSIFLSNRFSIEDRKLAANFLEEELSAYGMSVKHHNYKYKDSEYSSIKGTNVYCTIPATIETDEYIVIGAHYDSRGPGANDNASGVALVLPIIGEVLEMIYRGKNIIIALFDQEEIGIKGSYYFADSLYVSGTEINSAHTIDQIGWDSDGDKAIEIALPTKKLEILYKAANNETIQKPIYVTSTSSSDHSSFLGFDIPAIAITEEIRNGDATPYRHSAKDTYETINFDYLASSTHLVVYAIKVLLSQ